MQEYPLLFSPFKIRNTIYRNRIVSTPNGVRPIGHDRIAFFENKARGGAAAVTVGESPVSSSFMNKEPEFMWQLDRETDMPFMSETALAIKTCGAVPSIQLQHVGMEAIPQPCTNFRNPIGPVSFIRPDGIQVDAMDADLIEMTTQDFVNSALRMQRAGFEAIQIHCGHGWLLHQFLSRRVNTRKDTYGGSLENRARLSLEILDRIRAAVGNAMIIEVRISGDELVKNGQSLDEMIEFSKMLEGKADLINVSAGVHNNYETSYRMFPFAGYADHGCNVYLAEAIKKACKVPISTVGGISDPGFAEKILQEGKADIIGMARALIADPQWPNKAKKGMVDQITPCLRCNNCLRSKAQTHTIFCAVNPQVAREIRVSHIPAPKVSRNIMVIGGGIAGMEAACTAADRGHQVTLYERSDHLGGILKIVDYDDFKEDTRKFKDFMIRQTFKKVTVKLNTRVTPELINQEKPSAVICAVGSTPIVPPIPGINGENVMPVLESYLHQDKLGDSIVIIGGGMVGCEAAIWYSQCGKQVTVLEMLDHIGEPEDKRWYLPMIALFNSSPLLNYHTECQVKQITEGGVIYNDRAGVEQFIPVDTVLFSTGLRANTDVVESLRVAVREVNPAADFFCIGDCDKPQKITQAMQGGYYAAMYI